MIKGISKENGLEVEDLTLNQIVDTIDKMYSDPRVKTWEIREIMPLVTGRLKEGWTERDLDEVIAYLIKEREHVKKYRNYDSLSKSEKKKLEEEATSLVEPKVLKALKAYLYEQ